MNVIEIEGTGTFITECNDGSDNDGDGFIDYPDDPSCTSSGDNNEAPFDYVECNNGIDDDLDGFIDYPDDPSCDSVTDTTESPADFSLQPDSECDEETFCLFREQFPYDDDILLHGWEGDTSFVQVEEIEGNNRLVLYNLGSQDFNFFHNMTNPNLYNDIQYNYGIKIQSEGAVVGTQNFFIVLYDVDDREIMKWRYDLSRSGTTVSINAYTLDDYTWVHLFTSTRQTTEPDKLIFHTFAVDQILKTFEYLYLDHSGLTSDPTTYNWTNVLASKIHRLAIEMGSLSSNDWTVSIDNILITGEFADTLCDSWELPYYLVESFNGLLSECEWSVSDTDIYADGIFELTDDIDFWSAEKETDLVEEDYTRYATFTFDLNVINITYVGSTITFRLYTEEEFNFFTVFFRDSGDWLEQCTPTRCRNKEIKEPSRRINKRKISILTGLGTLSMNSLIIHWIESFMSANIGIVIFFLMPFKHDCKIHYKH